MRILHIMESLGIGGAEKLLIGTINGLKGDEHYLVILNGPESLRPSIKNNIVFKNLGITSKTGMLFAARWLRRFIREEKIDVVHAHLYWANIVSRLGSPREIPVFNSIHAISSQAAYNGRKITLSLEKLTYKKRHHIIAVSNEVLEDFRVHAGLKGVATVLYNFIDERFFAAAPKQDFSDNGLKMVAVGNLRYQKNYPYLIEAFKYVPAGVTLDIYGEGDMQQELQAAIDENHLPIRLCGVSDELHTQLNRYDAYVMSSFFEGQPLSLLEAMAAGLPSVLADIPVLREVTGDDAIYFDINDPRSFSTAINGILSGTYDLAALAAAGHRRVHSFAHQEQYLDRLRKIYQEAVELSKQEQEV